VTPLPTALGNDPAIVVWRLDKTIYARTWESGEGSFLNGGRWNSRGVRAVYCSFDPATTILEIAVHTGFDALDRVPRTLTSVTILDAQQVRIVLPDEIPNENWLRPGAVSAGQQRYGDDLLQSERFIALPSVTSRQSWNLIFLADRVSGFYQLKAQERFALDTRLNPVR
jgi:RES domain-containing protein